MPRKSAWELASRSSASNTRCVFAVAAAEQEDIAARRLRAAMAALLHAAALERAAHLQVVADHQAYGRRCVQL